MSEEIEFMEKPSHYGRIPIYTSETTINSENIRTIVEKAMNTHEKNRRDIRFLIDYEKGRQPILDRIKKVRPEINIKSVQNHASQIVDFKLAYVFGSPINYVQRAEKESKESDVEKDDTCVMRLNEMFYEENKASLDQELAKTFLTCGVAYRAAFPRKSLEKKGISDFVLLNLDPMTTFVIYSADVFHKKMLSVTYWDEPEDSAVLKKRHYTAYTDEDVFTFDSDPLGPISRTTNGIGLNPIIEYRNDYQKMGSFERVLGLLDAINLCTSDRMNGLAQFVQSFTWFNNVELDEDETKSLFAGGSLFTKSEEGLQASVQILSNALPQSDAQSLAMELYARLLEICHIPGREASSSSSTGQSTMLGGGWQEAEEDAHRQETMFREGEMELLRVVGNIISRADNEELREMKIRDIDIRFSRNKVANFLVKTQGLSNLLTAGVHPRIAFQTSDLFTDPQQAWLDSIPYLEAIQPVTDSDDKNPSGQDIKSNNPETVTANQNEQMSFVNGE